jgi:hypothetical protein
VTDWRGRLNRHDSSPYVHGAQRLWNVTEVLGRRLRNTNVPAPASLQEQLLIETTMIGVRQIISQYRGIAVLAAEVGPADGPADSSPGWLALRDRRAPGQHLDETTPGYDGTFTPTGAGTGNRGDTR